MEGIIPRVLLLVISLGPVCRAITSNLSLSAGEQAIITSPNFGPGQKYPRDIEYLWNIYASPSDKMTVTFNTFDVEPHSLCAWDYVIVNDDTCDSGTGQRHCGSSIPEPYITSSSSVCIRFHSDAIIPKAGFNFTVFASVSHTTSTPAVLSTPPVTPHLPHISCGSDTPISQSAIISSPGYGVDPTYPNNVVCLWNIELQINQVAVVAFDSFHLEFHQSCVYDWLKIYDSPMVTSQVKATFCGDTKPSNITLSKKSFIQFKSDIIVPKSGFLARIFITKTITTSSSNVQSPSSSSSPSPSPSPSSSSSSSSSSLSSSSSSSSSSLSSTPSTPVHSSTSSTTESTLSIQSSTGKATTTSTVEMCKGVSIVDDVSSLTLLSPGYSEGQYPLNIFCDITLTTGTDKKLLMSFLDFHLEYNPLCIWDSLSLYDGTCHSGALLGKYCGSSKPSNLTTLGNKLCLQFKSDFVVPKQGFKVVINTKTSVPLDGVQNNTTTGSGVLEPPTTSPGETPAASPEPSNSTSSGSASSDVPSTTTTTDNSKPIGGPSPPSTTTTSSSTSSTPTVSSSPSFSSSTENAVMPSLSSTVSSEGTSASVSTDGLTVSSNSDVSNTKTTLPASSPTKTVSPIVPMCASSEMNVYSAVTVTSPNLGPGQSYPPQTTCTLCLSSHQTQKLHLSFTEFDLEPHNTCAWDSLTVYDGNSTTAPTLATLCGGLYAAGSFTSSSCSLCLKFVSDFIVQKRGFKATVKPFEVSGRLASTSSTLQTSHTTHATSPTTSASSPMSSTTTSSTSTSTTTSTTLTITSDVSVHDTSKPKIVTETTPTTTTTSARTTLSTPTTTTPPTTTTATPTTITTTPATTTTTPTTSTTTPTTTTTTPTTTTATPTTTTTTPDTTTTTPTTSTTTPTTITTTPATTTTTTTTTTPTTTTTTLMSSVPLAACIGPPQELPISSGILSSPGFESQTPYPNNLDCKWLINTESHTTTHIAFTNFELESQNQCSWDSLTIYNGGDVTDDVIAKLCGAELPENITINGSQVLLHFHTDRVVSKTGFRLVYYTEVTPTKPASSTCPVGRVPCGNGTCIPSAWVCDGEANCVHAEDEVNCGQCSDAQFTCGDGTCISMYQRCDGNPHCSDMEDEDNCTMVDSTDEQDVLLIMRSGTLFPVCFDQWEAEFSNKACTEAGYGNVIQQRGKASPATAFLVPTGDVLGDPGLFHNKFIFSSACASGRAVSLTCQPRKCGRKSNNLPSAYILGGNRSVRGKWPWVVSLMSGPKQVCGATIISSTWVVTAGHCVETLLNSPQTTTIVAGYVNLDAPDVESARVTEIILHPEHNFIYNADIALLHLQRPLVFSDRVKPLCLPTRQHDWSTSLSCFIAGWGVTKRMNILARVTSPYLHHAQLHLWSQSKCRDVYPTKVKDTMICAGEESGSVDACKGDSGSPLMCETAPDRWELVGITSWGEGCGQVGKPGVYTRVDRYIDWIKQQTKDMEAASCSFESPNMCGYKDNSTEDFIWTRRKGGLAFPQRPYNDNTFGNTSGHYMYAFVSYESKNQIASLTSPTFSNSGFSCLTFTLTFMNAKDARLRVYGVSNSSGDTTMMMLLAPLQGAWRMAEQELGGDVSRVVFVAEAGRWTDGGVGLDDVKIENRRCDGTLKVSCDFDGGTFCEYLQAEDDSFDWNLKIVPLTDNKARASKGHNSDHYLEADGTNRNPGDKTRVVSPVLNTTVPQCISLQFKIYPPLSGTLSICTKSVFNHNTFLNCNIWSRASSEGNDWTDGHAQIPAATYPYGIVFQAERGQKAGVIAIDNLDKKDGECHL